MADQEEVPPLPKGYKFDNDESVPPLPSGYAFDDVPKKKVSTIASPISTNPLDPYSKRENFDIVNGVTPADAVGNYVAKKREKKAEERSAVTSILDEINNQIQGKVEAFTTGAKELASNVGSLLSSETNSQAVERLANESKVPTSPVDPEKAVDKIKTVNESIGVNKLADFVQSQNTPDSEKIANEIREKNKTWRTLPVEEREEMRAFVKDQATAEAAKNIETDEKQLASLTTELEQLNSSKVSMYNKDAKAVEMNRRADLEKRIDKLNNRIAMNKMRPENMAINIFDDDDDIIDDLREPAAQWLEQVRQKDPVYYAKIAGNLYNGDVEEGEMKAEIIKGALEIKNKEISTKLNFLKETSALPRVKEYTTILSRYNDSIQKINAIAAASDGNPSTDQTADLNILKAEAGILETKLKGFADTGIEEQLANVNKVYSDIDRQEQIVNASSLKYRLFEDKEKQEEANRFVQDNPVIGRIWNIVKKAAGIPGEIAKSGAVIGTEAMKRLYGLAGRETETGAYGVQAADLFDAVIPTVAEAPVIRKDGSIDYSNIINATANTLGDMATLLIGGGELSAVMKTAGVGAKTAASTGLMMSSYAQSRPDYFDAAISAGMDPKDANKFADASAILTSALELISPNEMLFGEGAKKAFTKEFAQDFAENLAKGDFKYAVQESGKRLAKEVGAENLQEISQLIGDKAVEFAANKVYNKEFFDANIKSSELKETVLLTTLATGVLTGIRNPSINKAEKTDNLIQAAKNFDEFQDNVDQLNLNPEEKAKVIDQVKSYSTALNSIPNSISEEVGDRIAPLLVAKQKLADQIKSTNVDEAFKNSAKEKIKVIDQAIVGLSDGRFTPEQINITDDPNEAAATNTEAAVLDRIDLKTKDYFALYEKAVATTGSFDEALTSSIDLSATKQLSDRFNKKYNPTGELTPTETFRKFYDEIKGKTNETAQGENTVDNGKAGPTTEQLSAQPEEGSLPGTADIQGSERSPEQAKIEEQRDKEISDLEAKRELVPLSFGENQTPEEIQNSERIRQKDIAIDEQVKAVREKYDNELNALTNKDGKPLREVTHTNDVLGDIKIVEDSGGTFTATFQDGSTAEYTREKVKDITGFDPDLKQDQKQDGTSKFTIDDIIDKVGLKQLSEWYDNDNPYTAEELKTGKRKVEFTQEQIDKYAEKAGMTTPVENVSVTDLGSDESNKIESVNNKIGQFSNLSDEQKFEGEKEALRELKEDKSVWIDNVEDLGNYLAKGTENKVYLDKAKNYVYKVNNLFQSKGLVSEVLNNIKVHNKYFPNTKYEFIGLTDSENGKSREINPSPVIKQPYISDNKKQASTEEIQEFMASKGFDKVSDGKFTNGEYIIRDLHPRNVLKDVDTNEIFVIDDIIEKIDENNKSTTEPIANKIINPDPVQETYKLSPRLSEIGNESEYTSYVDNIYPESQVKDVVYHGTNADFEVFDSSQGNPDTKTNTVGYHFIETAAKDAYKNAFGDKMIPVKLNFTNPLKVNYDTEEGSLAQRLEFLSPEDIKEFEGQGYDGGIITRDGETEYIAFHPEQIHILGNSNDASSFKEYKDKASTKNSVTAKVLDVPQSVRDAGYEIAILPMEDGRFVAIETNSKKQISNVYDTEQELIDTFEANKDKFTPEVVAAAIGENIENTESKSPTINLADKLRQLKSDPTKLYDGMLGFPVAVWNGAIETMATIIDSAKVVNEAVIKKAIKAAREYMEGYAGRVLKNLNTEDLSAIEKSLGESMNGAGAYFAADMAGKTDAQLIDELKNNRSYSRDGINRYYATNRELDRRDRASIVDVPISEGKVQLESYASRERKVISKKDMTALSEVFDKYENPKDLTDEEVEKDFVNSLMTSSKSVTEKITPYATEATLKNSAKELLNRGYSSEKLVEMAASQYEKFGYNTTLADQKLNSLLGPVLPGYVTRSEIGSFSERLRALKSNPNKIYDGLLGIPVAIWDGAIETMATILDGVNVINRAVIQRAIKAGSDYLKANAGRELSEDDLTQAETQLQTFLSDSGITVNEEINTAEENINEASAEVPRNTQESFQRYRKKLKATSNIAARYIKDNGIKSAKELSDVTGLPLSEVQNAFDIAQQAIARNPIDPQAEIERMLPLSLATDENGAPVKDSFETQAEFAERLREYNAQQATSNIIGENPVSIFDDAPEPRPVQEPGETIASWANRLAQWNYSQMPNFNPNTGQITTPNTGGLGTWVLPPETEFNYKAFKQGLKLGSEKFVRRNVDFLNRLKTAIDAIKKTGAVIPVESDPYIQYSFLSSKAAKAVEDLTEKVVTNNIKGGQEAIFQRVKKAGFTIQEFGFFTYAQHAEERNVYDAKKAQEILDNEIIRVEAAKAENIANGKSPAYQDRRLNELRTGKIPGFQLIPDGGSGMMTQDAKDLLQAFKDNGSYDELEAFAKEYRDAVTTPDLVMQYQNGLISKEEFDSINDTYKLYVPLQVEEKALGKRVPTITNVKSVRKNLQRSRGSLMYGMDKRINPVLAGIVKAEHSIIESAKNGWINSLKDLVIEQPNDDVWEIVKPTYIPQRNAAGAIIKMEDKTSQKIIDESVKGAENGKVFYIHIKDQVLREAITRKNVTKVDNIPFVKGLNKINTFYRTFYTQVNPDFLLANVFRDVQEGLLMLSEKDAKNLKRDFLKNVPKSAKTIYAHQRGERSTPESQKFEKYLNSGAKITFAKYSESIDNMKSIAAKLDGNESRNIFVKGGVAFYEGLKSYAEVAELSTRFSIYSTMLEKGYSETEAATLSRNATIDFNKKGEWTGYTNAMFLFLNAGTQGGFNAVRLLMRSSKARKFMGVVTAAGFALTAINNLFGGDDDEENNYWGIPEYERQSNIIIKKPFAKGFYKIPIGRTLALPFYVGSESFGVVSGNETVNRALYSSSINALSVLNPFGSSEDPLMAVVPTVLKPVAQYMRNKNGVGAPIFVEKNFGSERPNSFSSFKSNTGASKAVAETLNEWSGGTGYESGGIDVSPGTIDFVFSNAFGGTGKFVKKMVNFSVGAGTGDVDLIKKNIPIVSRFETDGKPKSYKGAIFKTLEESATNELTDKQVKIYRDNLLKALKTQEIDEKQFNKYYKDQIRNELRIKLAREHPEWGDLEMKEALKSAF